jgi:hypothetical protein
MNYFPGLALNLDPLDLCLLSSYYHRHDSPAPIRPVDLWIWKSNNSWLSSDRSESKGKGLQSDSWGRECLPSMYVALRSNPSTAKKKKTQKPESTPIWDQARRTLLFYWTRLQISSVKHQRFNSLNGLGSKSDHSGLKKPRYDQCEILRWRINIDMGLI